MSKRNILTHPRLHLPNTSTTSVVARFVLLSFYNTQYTTLNQQSHLRCYHLAHRPQTTPTSLPFSIITPSGTRGTCPGQPAPACYQTTGKGSKHGMHSCTCRTLRGAAAVWIRAESSGRLGKVRPLQVRIRQPSLATVREGSSAIRVPGVAA